MEKLSPEQNVQLNTLKTLLQSILPDIKAILDQGRLVSSDASQLFLFKGMYKSLQGYFDQFNATWVKLIEFFNEAQIPNVFPSKNDQSLQACVKRYYYEACAIYEEHMSPTPVAPALAHAEATLPSKTPDISLNDSWAFRACLPRINLPQFSGDQLEWPAFRDTFRSLIHEESKFSDIDKFRILVSSLRGPARAILKGIDMQADNYPQAWKILLANFDDKRRLANNYLKTVLNFPSFRTKPTASSLRHFLTTVIESVESFKQLKIHEADDFILLSLVLRCLDPSTRRDFEREYSTVEIPAFTQLVEFLKGEWRSLEMTAEESSTPTTRLSFSSGNKPKHPGRRHDTSLFADDEDSGSSTQQTRRQRSPSRSTSKHPCPICKANHSLYQCYKFRALSSRDKFAAIKEWSGCKNCLSPKHHTDACNSVGRCQTCRKKHHTWLHLSPKQEVVGQGETSTSSDVALSGISSSGEILLGTALVNIRDSKGHYQTIRIVTDCGSQHSFITKECVDRLGLSFSPIAPSIEGIGQTRLPLTYGVLSCRLKSRCGREEFLADAIIVENIAGHLPHSRVPREIHAYLEGFPLADPTYWKPQTIDFLLGADLFFDLVTGAPLNIRSDLPKLIPSKLGHIVAGKCHLPSKNAHSTSLLVQSKRELHDVMSRFWEVEELPEALPLSKEEKLCEEHYLANHYRLPCGRYVVALPFKSSIGDLKCPRSQAVRRLINLEHKLEHCPSLKTEYHQFMEEYLKLGHMQLAQNQGRYIIPHHCVTKEENGKNKLRVVFDASCHSSTGSLNDYLMVGPKLQRDIADILLAFRVHKVVLVADIIKMYRQILVRHEDRPFQHILWRSNPEEPMEELELNTITYGESSSSHLAIRTIVQLARDEGHRYPKAAKVLHDSIHVDDIVSGASTLEEALILQEQLISLLQLGGFELSKWKSNRQELLTHVLGADAKDFSLSGGGDTGCKILGLLWNHSTDHFTFKVQEVTAPLTKRGILSTIARIYDPLGFLAPVVFMAKVILQNVWKSECAWDEAVPTCIRSHWSLFADKLSSVSDIRIPRYVCSCETSSYSLIGFSDASERGYAGVVYLRSVHGNSHQVHLLKAKTKLAPTKLVSIPRLELCGALLLARLLKTCNSMKDTLGIREIHLFTDSTIVLGWLKQPVNMLKAFVAHRVAEIIEVTDVSSWHHVSSDFNPADSASRGIMPHELGHHDLWWTGPSWLKFPSQKWPCHRTEPISRLELPEMKPPIAISLLCEGTPPLIQWMSRFSSYPKLIRSMGYVLRVVQRSRRSSRCISLPEMENATSACIRLVQSTYLPKDQLSSKYWRSFAPFQDALGIFRVGGRLRHSNLPYDAKHPIILPKCHFTKLLVEYYHRIHVHAGPSVLQNILQGRYHICSARKLIRALARQCVTCQISAPRIKVPFMGDLPASRFREGEVFQNIGIDMAGPLLIKESNRRKAALGKAYLCLFICMVTKAVHLEVVTSCSTDSFLAALHRFIARRGKPHHVFSDCGTNFIGAASALRDLYTWYRSSATQDKITSFAAERDIEWHFNPPRAPHFGGLWEAGIKSAKSLLVRNVGSTPLTYEELSTLFCRIEAVLNSRPLYPLNNDPDALEALTPGHFLIGRALTAPPEKSYMPLKQNTLRRWQLIQQRVQHFWSKWRTAYLNQLQQRRKWTSHQPPVKEGDLVIIKDADCPPALWPLARVLNIHPGKDNIVRVVTILTPTGTYKRPVAKLAPLLLPNWEKDN